MIIKATLLQKRRTGDEEIWFESLTKNILNDEFVSTDGFPMTDERQMAHILQKGYVVWLKDGVHVVLSVDPEKDPDQSVEYIDGSIVIRMSEKIKKISAERFAQLLALGWKPVTST